MIKRQNGEEKQSGGGKERKIWIEREVRRSAGEGRRRRGRYG